MFRLIALTVIPAFLLILLEFGLRFAGVGHPTAFAVKSQLNGQPVYVANDQFGRRFFPEALIRTPVPFAVSTPKPEGTFRIVVLGGSAAQGIPDFTFGFGRYLEVLLRSRFPDIEFEIINAGMAAINSHVVREIAKDCVALDPDLFVVYMGNNEVVGPFGAGTVFTSSSRDLWLIRAGLLAKTTRIGQVLDAFLNISSSDNAPGHWQGMSMFLEQQVREGAPALETVYEHFRRNLSGIAATARSNGIACLVCTVGTNLQDSPPFASMHRPDITEPEKAQWDHLFKLGMADEERGDFEAAAARYREAAAIDAQYADLRFRLGHCAAALESCETAKDHFTAARDLDTLRFRADTRINEIIRSIPDVGRDGLYLVDVERAFAAESADGMPGDEYFYEHVHPNFAGNYFLARSILSEVHAVLAGLGHDVGVASSPLQQADCDQRLAVTRWERFRTANAIHRGFLRKSPFTNQSGHTGRLRSFVAKMDKLRLPDSADVLQLLDAEYRAARAENPEDVWLRYNHARFLAEISNAYDQAEQELELVLKALPNFSSAQSNMASVQLDLGNHRKAEALCRSVLERQPQDVNTRATLANALVAQQRFAEAIEQYAEVLKSDPDDPTIHNYLGGALIATGRPTEALAHLRDAVRLDPDYFEASYNLGLLLGGQRQFDDAIPCFRRAVELRPNSVAALFSLAQTLLLQGNVEEAVVHFEAAVKTDPNDPVARGGLDAALEIIERASVGPE